MARKVIALRYTDAPVIDEQDSAVDAIIPGHLVELVPTGGVRRNTDDDAQVARIFALEREELGRDIDEPYAIGDKVKVGYFHQGQFVYALLASGQNIARGQYLSGAPTPDFGTLVDGAASVAVAMALEAVDNSTGVNPRIRVVVV